MQTRREFLRHSTRAGMIAWGAAGLSPILAQAAEATTTDNVLLVVFLRGGNDGLNTVIPFRDPLYAKYRPQLRIDAGSVLSITDDLVLHPSLSSLADLWEDGRVTIVQGVGYPNHLRSHFESTAIWHAGHLQAPPNGNDGWLGRALDSEQARNDAPLAVSIGSVETPVPLRGRVLRTTSPADCSGEEAQRVARALAATRPNLPADDGLHKTVILLRRDAARYLQSGAAAQERGRKPTSVLAQKLRQAGHMIDSGNPARAYYLEHAGMEGNGGYDTHSAQREPHAALLRDLGDSLGGFIEQLQESGNDARVTVIVFSEFGRRAAENGSGGTDHGTAGPVILLRRPGSGGIVGPTPDLERLDNGDIAVSIDFRSVYATLLRDVFEIDPASVLGSGFEVF